MFPDAHGLSWGADCYNDGMAELDGNGRIPQRDRGVLPWFKRSPSSSIEKGISFPYGAGRYHNISSSSASSPTGFCLSVTQVPTGPVILEKRRVLVEKVVEHSLL